MKIVARFERQSFRFEPSLLIYQVFDDHSIGLFKPMEIVRVTPEEEAVPCITGEFAREFLQAVTDAAFEAGIYPSGLRDKTDELKATKYHLEDMRKLTFAYFESPAKE